MKITQKDFDSLEFLLNRLVNVYNESPNTDYLLNARVVLNRLSSKIPVGAIDKKYIKIQKIAGFNAGAIIDDNFDGIRNILLCRRQLASNIIVTPESKLQEEQIKLFDFYNEQIKAYLIL